ncbi:hypothetical protein GCM10011583_41760 [Streptomyces camponoticapitis]|uniref:Uncharacterized protein n=1 Tax=Streptomyces camponoticapitis TaxID=1616125 RepID=A0ABQ2EFI2_9ACTN|nr:hypothetical protein GCM10011583_41760 [Streptomyces camponoticapitis]
MPEPCQYVDWLPSAAIRAEWSLDALLAAAVLPAAMLGPSAAEAVSDGTPTIRRLVLTAAAIARHLHR